MSLAESIVKASLKRGREAQEFLVSYVPEHPEPTILSVHSAMGERLHTKHHPRIKNALILQSKKTNTAA